MTECPLHSWICCTLLDAMAAVLNFSFPKCLSQLWSFLTVLPLPSLNVSFLRTSDFNWSVLSYWPTQTVSSPWLVAALFQGLGGKGYFRNSHFQLTECGSIPWLNSWEFKGAFMNTFCLKKKKKSFWGISNLLMALLAWASLKMCRVA